MWGFCEITGQLWIEISAAMGSLGVLRRLKVPMQWECTAGSSGLDPSQCICQLPILPLLCLMCCPSCDGHILRPDCHPERA